ncbi:hypothetical protein EOL70_04360 [Leucothrix sargassi]|nr:hypothetical protein EOL70_04360 [Leucothrix sargassi]
MSGVNEEMFDLTLHLIKKGPKFRSHTIVFEGEQASLKPTFAALAFCLIYVVVGLFLLGLATAIYMGSRQVDLIIFLSILGASITTFGITLLQPFMKWSVFDKKSGKYRNHVDRSLMLENILSLQITNKMVLSKHGISYPCYELNVLTKFGRRLNVLNHNDLAQMQADGEKLAEFLDVKLLDCQKEITL